jgi:hypothetical protein
VPRRYYFAALHGLTLARRANRCALQFHLLATVAALGKVKDVGTLQTVLLAELVEVCDLDLSKLAMNATFMQAKWGNDVGHTSLARA